MLSCAYNTRNNKLCSDPAGKRRRLDDAGPPTASPGDSSSSPPGVPPSQGKLSIMNVTRNVMHDTNSDGLQTVLTSYYERNSHSTDLEKSIACQPRKRKQTAS